MLTLAVYPDQNTSIIMLKYLINNHIVQIFQSLTWMFLLSVYNRNYKSAEYIAPYVKPDRPVYIVKTIKNDLLDIFIGGNHLKSGLKSFLNLDKRDIQLINPFSTRCLEIKKEPFIKKSMATILVFNYEQLLFMKKVLKL